jgi:hypothetical protein
MGEDPGKQVQNFLPENLPTILHDYHHQRGYLQVMRRLEGGDWKSASTGNSLVAYPTSSTVLEPSGGSDPFV